MNNRLKNTLFGALGFGLGFSLLQLFLSIDLDYWAFPGLLLSILFFIFFGSLMLGGLAGFIFGINRNKDRKYISKGTWSFGLILGIIFPVAVVVSSAIYFSINYVTQGLSPEFYSPELRFFFTTPFQVYGAIFGLVVGCVIGMVFGRGSGQLVWTTILTALGFGLGGYLMGGIAPTDTYLGILHPDGPLIPFGPFPWQPPSVFLTERILGGFLFGTLGGAALGFAHE